MAPFFHPSRVFKGPGCRYYYRMPIDPLVSAIVSSVVSSVLESALTPAPQPVQPFAVMRMLPEETLKGTMSASGFGFVKIDGKMMPLSPGAQIRDEMNMIVMPGMTRIPAKVRFQVDMTGSVHRLWVLSSAEASLP